jgi:hypothetical protein
MVKRKNVRRKPSTRHVNVRAARHGDERKFIVIGFPHLSLPWPDVLHELPKRERRLTLLRGFNASPGVCA